MELATLEHAGPLAAWKVAEIRGGRSPRVHPVGPTWRFPIEHRGTVTARCRHTMHRAPDLDCTCGFHAVSSLDELAHVTPIHADSAVLAVGLTGVVVEHERGMRAQEQTVRAVLLPDECYSCRRPSSHVSIAHRFWRAVCPECSEPETSVRTDEAASLIGVPVMFADLKLELRSSWRVQRWGSIALAMMAAVIVALTVAARRPSVTWIAISCVPSIGSAALAATVWSTRTSRNIGRCLVAQCWAVTGTCLAAVASALAG